MTISNEEGEPSKASDELEIHYRHTLEELGKRSGMLGVIFRKAQNKIQDPAKLRRPIVDLIDKEQWSSLSADVKGDAYEGLLQKYAEDCLCGVVRSRRRPTPLQSDQVGRRIDIVVGLLTRAVDRGQAAGVVELVERALCRVELTVMEVQDSEYWSSGVLEKLSALHRRACEISRPDPIGLATRWLNLRLKSPLGLHDVFPERYRDVLGPTGLARLDRLIETALAKLPASDSRRGPDHKRVELELLRAEVKRMRET